MLEAVCRDIKLDDTDVVDPEPDVALAVGIDHRHHRAVTVEIWPEIPASHHGAVAVERERVLATYPQVALVIRIYAIYALGCAEYRAEVVGLELSDGRRYEIDSRAVVADPDISVSVLAYLADVGWG